MICNFWTICHSESVKSTSTPAKPVIARDACRETERTIEEETRWQLSEEESTNIQRLLANPPAMNAAARKAAKDLAAHVRIRS